MLIDFAEAYHENIFKDAEVIKCLLFTFPVCYGFEEFQHGDKLGLLDLIQQDFNVEEDVALVLEGTGWWAWPDEHVFDLAYIGQA